MTDLFVPIAGNLSRSPEGHVICGERTIRSCNHAIALWRKQGDGIILASPGKTNPDWGNVRMSDLMIRHFAGNGVPDSAIRTYPAETFNTFGEVLASAKCAAHSHAHGSAFDHVVYTVEVWRKRRVHLLASRIFRKLGLETPFAIKTHGYPHPAWLVYEYFARKDNNKRLVQLGYL